MVKAESRVYQLHLGEPVPEIIYQFNQGTFIYPWGSHRGVLRNSVMARQK